MGRVVPVRLKRPKACDDCAGDDLPSCRDMLEDFDSGVQSLHVCRAVLLWDLERKSDVDLDRIYGDGTIELRGRMEALVLLKWRRDGQGLDVRHLSVGEALEALPLVYKNLGAFDLDRTPGSGITDAERDRYRELFGRVTVVEVTGRVDFARLVPVIDQLLSR